MRATVARLVKESDDDRRVQGWLAVDDDVLQQFPELHGTGPGFTAGAQSTGWDCGSAAVPTTLDDFDNPDDAANCAGRTPASVALYSIALAGVGLGAVAITSRAAPTRRESEQPSSSGAPG